MRTLPTISRLCIEKKRAGLSGELYNVDVVSNLGNVELQNPFLRSLKYSGKIKLEYIDWYAKFLWIFISWKVALTRQ